MRSKAITALSFGLLLSATTQLRAQDHVYNLNATLADANGGPALASLGGTLSASGFTFGANQGLSLTGVFGPMYTVAMRFSFANVDGYRRMIDFQNRASDTGPYVLNGASNFYNVSTGSTSPYTPDQLGLTIFTRTAGGLFSAYFDGALQYQFLDGANLAAPSTNTVSFFQDDVSVGGEASAGFVNYIATWDQALSEQEVAAFVPGRAVTTVPEPSSLLLVGAGLLFASVARTRKRRTA